MLINNTTLIITSSDEEKRRLSSVAKTTDYKTIYTAKNATEGMKFLREYKMYKSRMNNKYPPAKIIFDGDMKDAGVGQFMEFYRDLEHEDYFKAKVILISEDDIDTEPFEDKPWFRCALLKTVGDSEIRSALMTDSGQVKKKEDESQPDNPGPKLSPDKFRS